MNISLNEIPLDDQPTWDFISDGNVVGCFQIEGRLGKQLSKRLKPQNIEQLAGLIAIMRPGCLEGKLSDGKSIADHYIMRKNGDEQAICDYKALEDILAPTYYLMIYQESAAQIAQKIAGMSLDDAVNRIVKGIAKKKTDIIAKVKVEFLDGCKKLGLVTEEEAQQIFQWIEVAQRYSFNKSHSVSYAMNTYMTAYLKVHKLERFYRSWLEHSKHKQKPLEEIRRLVEDARKNNVEVSRPNVALKCRDFTLNNGKIEFGLVNIKGIGENVYDTIVDQLPDDFAGIQWAELLFKYLIKIKKNAVKALIAVGGFDFLDKQREEMLYEHDNVLNLTDKELKYIVENYCFDENSTTADALQFLIDAGTGRNVGLSNKNRVHIVTGIHRATKFPIRPLYDDVKKISNYEESFLGIGLTCSKFDVFNKSAANATCLEVNKGLRSSSLHIFGQITAVKEHITKDGEDMAFLDFKDDTDEISVVVFPDIYTKFHKILKQHNVLIISGYKKQDSVIFTGGNICNE